MHSSIVASGQLRVHVGLNRVAQVMIHTQVVSQGTGVVNVHNEDIAAFIYIYICAVFQSPTSMLVNCLRKSFLTPSSMISTLSTSQYPTV
jgi:redox-regulated HSP33 family molecular chaperone